MTKDVLKNGVIVLLILMLAIVSIIIPTKVIGATYKQELKSGISSFPTSYQSKLKSLQSKHPNWEFQAYYTGISWNDVIKKERNEKEHPNRVISSSPESWKHSCGFKDDGGYVCASDEIVKYYMDPRNFLDETRIFQFVECSYNSDTQTVSAIEKSLDGTFMDTNGKKITCEGLDGKNVSKTYAEMIVDAAKASNVSAFYIKSKIIQEVGSKGSDSVSGKYPGYEGYYNFYNYGANDTGNAIKNGLKYAKEQGWDSQYKAIVLGAETIGNNYINQGQNTPYFNKFDVVGTKILKVGQSQTVDEKNMFWHQYMTNVQDPWNQSTQYKKLYNDIDGKITFIIPVYNNMNTSNPMPEDVVPLKSFSLSKTSVTLTGRGDTDFIKVTYNPTNTTERTLNWTSSNEKVATVSKGNVTAVGAGTATLTAKTPDGKLSKTCKVTVNPVEIKDFSLETDELTLNVRDEDNIKVYYTPSNTTERTLNWTSSNEKVATVSKGDVTAVGAGTATLTAKTPDGKLSKTCKVTVKTVPLKSFSLGKTSTTLNIGETDWIRVIYNPTNATDRVISWESSNPKVATVSKGDVVAVGEGTATLTATSRDGGLVQKCTVTVKDPNKVYLKSFSLGKTSTKLNIGETDWIRVIYNPTNVTDRVISWESSNEKVATVSKGNVVAVGEGTATLTATSRDGGIVQKCTVTVIDPNIYLKSFSLEKTNITLNGRGDTDWIRVIYNPTNVTDRVIYWESSNENVVTVSKGNITSVGAGTATLTAKSRDGGLVQKCTVTVKPVELKSFSLGKTSTTLNIGETDWIRVIYNPTNVTDRVISWTSSNEKVATVSKGNVLAVGAGTATLTATSRDGGIVQKCTVTVKDPNVYLKSFSLEKTNITLTGRGATDWIRVIYNPSNVTDRVIYWESSNENVVTVSKGNVTAVGEGTATLTATSRDGKKAQECKVTVKPVELKSFSLGKTSTTLNVGDTDWIRVIYTPSNTTERVINWKSSDEDVVKVSKGDVTAVGKGTSTLTATSANGKITKTCKVTVK